MGWGGGLHGKGHSVRHDWMIRGGQERVHNNYHQQQRYHWIHLHMHRGGGQEYDRHIGHHCCHYFPYSNQI